MFSISKFIAANVYKVATKLEQNPFKSVTSSVAILLFIEFFGSTYRNLFRIIINNFCKVTNNV